MIKKIIIFWSYLVEIILSSVVLLLLCINFELDTLSDFVRILASDFASTFIVVMLGGAIAFFWTFYSKSDSEFSKWLYYKGAYNVYLGAYLTAICIYSILLMLLILVKKVDHTVLSIITLWFLILGVINTYTFMNNIKDQLRLNMEFNKQYQDNK